jgi:transcriptional regulator with XRE-family HTH domain
LYRTEPPQFVLNNHQTVFNNAPDFVYLKYIFDEFKPLAMPETSTHIGRKISRIRELRGMKQEALAAELGISQQAVSKMEQSDKLEDEVLEKIAKVLGITGEGIKNFSDEAVFNYFNNFNDSSSGDFRQHCTFNPIDKLVEAYKENKKLYERLLQSEKEKVELLKKVIG